MANTTTALQPVRESGLWMGFANLLRKDMGEWWGTKTWLIHLVIWTAMISGIVLAVVNAPIPTEDAPPGMPIPSPSETGVLLFTVMTGLATAIGIVIVMQDAIVGEKQSGTAAWVLSKPVSRAAFILSKLVANGVSAVLLMVVVQGVLSALILSSSGAGFPLSGWVAGVGMLALHVLFYLTLTLMLGTFFDGRGPVIGIPMILLFGYQFLVGFLPGIAEFMPWFIIYPPADQSQNLGAAMEALSTIAIRGLPLPTVTPVIASAVWSIIFVAVAIWRFRKEEF